MRITLVALALVAASATSSRAGLPIEHLAHQDRLNQPQAEYAFCYYFSTDHLLEPARTRTQRVLAFAIASLSSGTQLDSQIPIQVQPGLYRVNSRYLGWSQQLPAILKQHYPYSKAHGTLPLVVRADWFIQFVFDSRKSGDAYFRLLFGKPITTVDQLLVELGADLDSDFTYAHIESNSRVAVNKVRLITTVPTLRRTDLWWTFDFEEINGKTDPLENLARGIRDGKHDHQASELIFGLPKSLPGAAGATGQLQGYALANGQGQIQTVAPANIVVDHTGTRGPEIVNSFSCIACHVEGLREVGTNALREYLNSGAQAYINDYQTQQQVDRFHLTEIRKYIERGNIDYGAAVRATSGYSTAENAASFAQVLRDYDQPLTLAEAARELYVSPEELTAALGWWSAAGKTMPARLAALAHGGTIPRTSWESEYRFCRVNILTTWRASR